MKQKLLYRFFEPASFWTSDSPNDPSVSTLPVDKNTKRKMKK